MLKMPRRCGAVAAIARRRDRAASAGIHSRRGSRSKAIIATWIGAAKSPVSSPAERSALIHCAMATPLRSRSPMATTCAEMAATSSSGWRSAASPNSTSSAIRAATSVFWRSIPRFNLWHHAAPLPASTFRRWSTRTSWECRGDRRLRGLTPASVGAGGMWKDFPAARESGMPLTAMAAMGAGLAKPE